jgi:hypothetical protein
MDWGFIWLMFILKIPLAFLLGIVWWAIKQENNPLEERSDGGNVRAAPGRHPRRPLPRPPRRGPHAEPPPPSPERVRTVVARSRQLET